MKLMTTFPLPVSLWKRICVLEIMPCDRESFLALMSVRNIIRIYTPMLPLKKPRLPLFQRVRSVPSVDLWKLFLYVNVTICMPSGCYRIN